MFLADIFVSSSIRICHFNVGLLEHTVQIFMHQVENIVDKLARILLPESLELGDPLAYDLLEFVRSSLSTGFHPHLFDQTCVRLGQAALHAQGVLNVDIFLVTVEQEVLCELISICETLKTRIHKASIAEILQTAHTLFGVRWKNLIKIKGLNVF